MGDPNYEDDPDVARLLAKELVNAARLHPDAQLWNGTTSIGLFGASSGRDNVIRIQPLYAGSPPCLLAVDGLIVIGRPAEYLHQWVEKGQFPALETAEYQDAYVVGVALNIVPRDQDAAFVGSSGPWQRRSSMPEAIRSSLQFPKTYWNSTDTVSDDLVDTFEVTDPTPVLVPIGCVFDQDLTICAPTLWKVLPKCHAHVQQLAPRRPPVSPPRRTRVPRNGAPRGHGGSGHGLARQRGAAPGQHSEATSPQDRISQEAQLLERRMILYSRRIRLPWRSPSTLLHYLQLAVGVDTAQGFGIIQGRQPNVFMRSLKKGLLFNVDL